MAELASASRVSEVEAAKRAVERRLADATHDAVAEQQRLQQRLDSAQAALTEAGSYEDQWRTAQQELRRANAKVRRE